MKYLSRMRILLWFPYVIFFFPLVVLVGKEKADAIADFIIDAD